METSKCRITYRKRKRTLTPRVAWPICLAIFHCSENFVHSFQAALSAFNHDRPVGRHTIRNGELSLFATTKKHNTTDIETDSTKLGGSWTEESMLDVLQNGGKSTLPEPDYCCVDCDDISGPFVSREDSDSTFLQYTDDGLILPAGPIGQLKESIANFLKEPSVEILISLVVLLNSLLVALSTLDSLNAFLPMIRVVEIIIGTIFFADFAARWFSSSREELGFILDPQFVIDILVAILPFAVVITPSSFWQEVALLPSALAEPSGLFNLQLLRVLRLQRFLQDLDTFDRFMEQATGRTSATTYIVQDWQLQLARVGLSLFTLISVATGLIYTAEHTVNPNINNYFDALYFGLTTLTTVGFGDVTPVTSQGRLIVCGSILSGVAVVPAQAAALLEALLDREDIRNGRTKSMRNKITKSRESTVNARSGNENDLTLNTTFTCRQCGASFHWSSAQYCYRCGSEVQF